MPSHVHRTGKVPAYFGCNIHQWQTIDPGVVIAETPALEMFRCNYTH